MSQSAKHRGQCIHGRGRSVRDTTPDLSSNVSGDRRVRRTKGSLHSALNALILKKGFEATTIKEIVETANVGRSTFYAHHGGKEGLLLSGLRHLREALLESARQEGSSKEKPPALGFSPRSSLTSMSIETS